MANWDEDQAAIFGAPDQDALNARMRADAARPQAERQPGRRRQDRADIQQGTPMWNDNGDSFALGGFNTAQGMAGQQANNLQGIANMTMGVIEKENDKRVALSREMRRMEHERQMKQMEIDAMLQRLEQERRRPSSGMGGAYDPLSGRGGM